MDAVVEVATAGVAAKVVSAVINAVRTFLSDALSQVVVTFTTRVLSMGSHSISAVAPDNFFRKELAKAGA